MPLPATERLGAIAGSTLLQCTRTLSSSSRSIPSSRPATVARRPPALFWRPHPRTCLPTPALPRTFHSGFGTPAISDDVLESVRPHLEHPFVLGGEGSTAMGALTNLAEGAGRLDDRQNGQNSPDRRSLPLSYSTSFLFSHRTPSPLQPQNELVSTFATKPLAFPVLWLSPQPPRAPPLR